VPDPCLKPYVIWPHPHRGDIHRNDEISRDTPNIDLVAEQQQSKATLFVATNEPHVGQTLSLHYYYLAFAVLMYLAYLIAVNTSYRLSLGTTDLGIQALIALDWIRLVIRRK
jgi:hypothetical protein